MTTSPSTRCRFQLEAPLTKRHGKPPLMTRDPVMTLQRVAPFAPPLTVASKLSSHTTGPPPLVVALPSGPPPPPNSHENRPPLISSSNGVVVSCAAAVASRRIRSTA